MDLHKLAEERSIAFHRRVAERMRSDPTILERARAKAMGWLAAGRPHELYAREWVRILGLPPNRLEEALVDPSESARALRQVTPFAGALPPRERWDIWREFALAWDRSR